MDIYISSIKLPEIPQGKRREVKIRGKMVSIYIQFLDGNVLPPLDITPVDISVELIIALKDVISFVIPRS